MSKYQIFKISIIIFLSFRCLSICEAFTVKDLYLESKGGEYSVPDPEELKKAKILFDHIFRGEIDDNIREQWSELGFDVVEKSYDEKLFVIIVEKGNEKRGRGFYVFNRSLCSDIAMQIPHRFGDMYTGNIGFKMILEGDFASCAWNTVHRNTHQRGTLRGADMAHLEHSYLTAYTESFIDNYPEGFTVQLHGFSKAKRRDGTNTSYDVVLSSGSRVTGPSILELDECLDICLSNSVRVYPFGVKELGATTNTIGALIRKKGLNSFIHIEMSKTMRLKILDSRELRSNIIQCITDSIK